MVTPGNEPSRARTALRGLLRRAGIRRPGSARATIAYLEDKRAAQSLTIADLRAQRARLSETIAGQAAELERVRAAADVASGRDRPDLSYLFVVTYGRSGSTLLQGILSSTPGVVIRGENGAALNHLFHFHDKASRSRYRLTRSYPLPERHSWWGIDGYRADTALRNMRQLVLETLLRPAPDTRVVGFKEIYWMPDRMQEFLEFMQQLFPGARFVFNTRDLSEVAKSRWWARKPDAEQELQQLEKQYAEALDFFGDAVFRVHYNDYIADPSALRPLFDWLGEEFDEDRVRAVMEIRHSY
ncbi:MAG: hypothetical protein QOI54_396 [Actinomycetota bacterium]|nr:hypothetical protein [Actinomycetota bacterium]